MNVDYHEMANQLVNDDAARQAAISFARHRTLVLGKVSARADMQGRGVEEIESLVLKKIESDPLGFIIFLEIWKYQNDEESAAQVRLPVHETIKAPPSIHSEPKAEFELDGPACMMRPGDPGYEECEACQ
jgi:hypothetical protein